MSTPLAEIPEGLVEVDLHEATASVQLDDSLYPLPAVYGAAYVFIDRCYVLLDRPAAGRIRITLARKQPAEADDEAARAAQAEALHALVGELANELLACAFRHQLAQDNRVLVETVTMQAIAGAMGPPSLADLADFDFTDDALDDPLGIAQSWEEKHGRTLARPGAAEGGEP
jgi:His-Xaa-Ser system protein HxsD